MQEDNEPGRSATLMMKAIMSSGSSATKSMREYQKLMALVQTTYDSCDRHATERYVQ